MKEKVHILDGIGIFFLVEMYVVYQLDAGLPIKIAAGIVSIILMGFCFVAGNYCDLKKMDKENAWKGKKAGLVSFLAIISMVSIIFTVKFMNS